MTFEDAIGDILKANSNLTDLCSNIYGGIAPQNGSLPYIVFNRSGQIPTPDKQANNIGDLLLEIDIYATGYNEAIEIADAAREALDLSTGSYTGFDFSRARFDSQSSVDYDPETRAYYTLQGYIIWYKYT